MKLKERFKKALFAFFKAEILEAVEARKPQGVQYVPPIGRVVETRLPYQLACTISFDEREMRDQHMPIQMVIDKRVEHARRQLFDEFIKHVEVDTSFLVERYSPNREIRLSIFIGKKP